jgi:hypothetical protein
VIIGPSKPPSLGGIHVRSDFQSLDRSSIVEAIAMRFSIKIEGKLRYADIVGSISLVLTVIGLIL